MGEELGRWSAGQDEPPGELEALLTSAKSELPSAAHLAKIEAGLGSLLDQPPAGGMPGKLPAGKLLTGLAVGAALVGAGLWWTQSPSTPAPTEIQSAAPQQAVPSPPLVEAPPAPTPMPSDSPSAHVSAGAPDTPAPQPVAPRPAAQKPSEASLLNQARAALKSDPKRALALARRHQQLYPRGVLAQEREVIAIDALSRLDKKGDAERRANEFEKSYPESAHQKKVETTVDKH